MNYRFGVFQVWSGGFSKVFLKGGNNFCGRKKEICWTYSLLWENVQTYEKPYIHRVILCKTKKRLIGECFNFQGWEFRVGSLFLRNWSYLEYEVSYPLYINIWLDLYVRYLLLERDSIRLLSLKGDVWGVFFLVETPKGVNSFFDEYIYKFGSRFTHVWEIVSHWIFGRGFSPYHLWL